MNSVFRLSAISLVAAGPLLSAAYAQENYYSRDKYEAVLDRQQPEFDPEAVRVGGLIVNASAEAGITSSSNVFATSQNEQSDTIVRVGARAAARTNWNNHEVGVRVSAFRDEYSDISDESSNDLRASLHGRLDATKSLSLNGSVFAEDLSEARTDFANAIGVDRPIEFERTGARVGANYQADRIRWSTNAEFAEEDYEDGTTGNGAGVFRQNFRDRSTTNLRSRLSYAVSPDLAVFGQASLRSSEYDTTQWVDSNTGQILDPLAAPLPPSAMRRIRDSDTYTASVGVNFELQSLIRGDLSVGVLTEDKKDPAQSDVDSLSLNGRMQWFPSRLTTATFDAGREVRDLGLVESSSAIQTRFGATVDHELRRNIVVSLYGRITDNEYDDIDRNEQIAEFGTRGTYKLNKRVHLEAFARRVDRDVSGAQVVGDPGFEANLFGIGIKIYP